jgi:hypothetical protein
LLLKVLLTEDIMEDAETQACVPIPVDPSHFNPRSSIPYGLTIDHLRRAMQDFIGFLGFINQQLHTKEIPRLESFLMPANFSSIVGEYMHIAITKYCPTLVKNRYHNGHPDLLPKDVFPGDAAQHAHEGIEIKASRNPGGWQGHNPESIWLMVFYYDSNSSADKARGVLPRPFQFRGVYLARLEEEDWSFSGRSGESRRTITASVNRSGVAKMRANWVYDSSVQSKAQLSFLSS